MRALLPHVTLILVVVAVRQALLVLAVASPRLRPPAADGQAHRRGQQA